MYYVDKWYFPNKTFEEQIVSGKVDFVFESNSCFRSMHHLDKSYFPNRTFEKQMKSRKVDFVFELNSCFRSNHECTKIRLLWAIYQFHGAEGGYEDDAKVEEAAALLILGNNMFRTKCNTCTKPAFGRLVKF